MAQMLTAIIEDQPAIRHLLAEILSTEGFRTTAFADARSAAAELSAAELSSGLPDLYIVDWLLPDGTPEEFLRGAMGASSRARCLIISGYPVDLDQFPREWAPRIAYLEKPFTAAMLREMIASLFAFRT